MLYLNIKNVCNLRGIDNPHQFLRKNGFTIHTTHRLVNNQLEGISYQNLEKLCIILNCTPNDLISFTPSKDSTIPQSHPIHKLNHTNESSPLGNALKSLPLEIINELRTYLDQLPQKLPK